MEGLLQIVWAGLGSLGFCWLFNVRSERAPYVTAGAMITWGLYLMAQDMGMSVFACSLLSAVFATGFCEVLAYGLKAPVTAFLMPVLIPLVPGGGLYHTVYNLITGDTALTRQYGMDTAMTCLGLVLGITGVQFVIMYWKGRRRGAAE